MNGYSSNGDGPFEPLELAIPPQLIEAVAQRVASLLAEQIPNCPEPYFDVAQAAEYLAAKPRRIYELKAQGRLRHYQDGTRLLFRTEDLDAALLPSDGDDQRP